MASKQSKNKRENSMRKARITKTAVENLQENQTIRDTEIGGFGARRRKGAPSYFLQTRINGRLRWITIGPHGAPWTAATARKEALSLLSEINKGIDPGHAKAVSRKAPALKEVAERFFEEHGNKLKPSTLRDYRSVFRHHIDPALGHRKIKDISRKDVSGFHSALVKIPRQANYALAVLSKIMNWAEEQGLRPEHTNPCYRVKRFAEKKRQRFLSSQELERLGRTLAECESEQTHTPYVFAAIRLLVLTGARLGEILSLQWQHVDLERGLLLLPDSKTGQKVIFLNWAAVELLSGLAKMADNPHVICGRKKGAHLINLQKPWQYIRKRAELEDVRLHDLRHSFASIAAASGASLSLIGKLLGHTQAQTTERYAHLVKDQATGLNELVGDRLSKALGGGK